MVDPADLVRLADGDVPPERRAALEAAVAADPEMAAAVERQRRASLLVREASAATAAPLALRERLAAQQRAPALRRRRAAWLTGLAGAAAAIALAVFVALPVGAPGGPSVVEAAQLGARPASERAPARDAANPALLASAVDGVPFPSWAGELGWKAAGSRTDDLDGRRAVTVFYERDGRRVAYTIVAGAALAVPDDSRRLRAERLTLAAFEVGGRPAVTWTRRGRTCVLSGAPVDVLTRLAAWRADGAIPF